jgi:hypothetical protein
MEIKKIVVDELPESCKDCLFSNKDSFGYIWCKPVQNRVSKTLIGLPSWCPLQVEDACVYTGEYGGWDENGDTIFFSKKTTCSDKHIQKVSIPNNTFCPNCGKRIRYEEE